MLQGAIGGGHFYLLPWLPLNLGVAFARVYFKGYFNLGCH